MWATSIYTAILAVLWFGWRIRRWWRSVERGTQYSPAVKTMPKRYAEDAQAVHDASPEVDGRRLFKVLGGTGNFPDVKTSVDDLREHLVVKNKIV